MMDEDDGSTNHASLLFLDKNHNSMSDHSLNYQKDDEDVSNADLGNIFQTHRTMQGKLVSSKPIRHFVDQYHHNHQEHTKFKYGCKRNQTNFEEPINIFKPTKKRDSKAIIGSAMTGNDCMSHSDRCGNWRSSKNVPSRHNGERHHPETEHYTMAWIKNQNR